LAHTEIIASQTDLAQELVNVVERVAEPIADPAVLPTAILARAAGRHVGVVLSGEGADELFGGYPTYLGHHWSDAYCRLPVSVRHGIRGILHRMPSSHAKVPLRWLLRRFVDHASRPTLDRHIAWFGAQIGPVAQPEDIRSIWQKSAQSFTELSRMMYLDYCTYLRALLVKIDRATMLASLESRAPYLDGTVTGFAWALPDRLKVRGIRTKVLLKQVAMRYLPGRIVHRRKRGLSVPVSQLMGRELCAEFERHVCDDRFAHLDLFPPGRVGEIVSEHETGRAHHARALWTLMVLGMWTEKWTGA
jgi:asparagine synthase (glutamine-hydrolysing)